MNPLLLLKLKSAGSFMRKHWGKFAAGAFFLVWVLFTVILYNGNQTLHEELGAASVAVEVCVTERANMDGILLKLKNDIDNIQKENNKYKTEIAKAEVRIEDLKEAINISLIEIDKEVIPVECEATFDWMLEKAIQ